MSKNKVATLEELKLKFADLMGVQSDAHYTGCEIVGTFNRDDNVVWGMFHDNHNKLSIDLNTLRCITDSIEYALWIKQKLSSSVIDDVVAVGTLGRMWNEVRSDIIERINALGIAQWDWLTTRFDLDTDKYVYHVDAQSDPHVVYVVGDVSAMNDMKLYKKQFVKAQKLPEMRPEAIIDSILCNVMQ